jgi:hypothetical protein
MAAIAAGGKEINFDKKTIKDTSTGKTSRITGSGSKKRIVEDEETKKSSAPASTQVGGTTIFIESDSPEDIGGTFAGQKILTSSEREREQLISRAKKSSESSTANELIGRTSSEIPNPELQVQRKYFDVVTSPQSDERDFLKSVAPKSSLGILASAAVGSPIDKSPFSPEFKMFAEGRLEVLKDEKKSSKTTDVVIGQAVTKEIKSADDIIKMNVLSMGLPSSSDTVMKSVDEITGFKIPESDVKSKPIDVLPSTFTTSLEGTMIREKEEKTMRLVPTEQEKIRQKDIKEQQDKFVETVEKQNLLNKEIQDYMSTPSNERSVSKGRELMEKSKTIDTELKINPYVTETARGYEFTGQILPDTVIESKSTTTTPLFLSSGALAQARKDSITGDKIERTLKGERGEFLQGYYSYLQGDVQPLVDTAGTRTIGEEGKLTAGAIAGSFAGATGISKLSDAGKGDIGQTKFISQPLKEMGISDPYAERIAKTATFGSRTAGFVLAAEPLVAASAPTVSAALSPTLGRIGAGASARLATRSAFAQGLTRAGINTAGAGLLVVPGAVKTGYGAVEGYEKTGTIGGALSFGGLSAAEYGLELGALGSLVKAGVTSSRAAEVTKLEKQAASFRRGENIDVVIQKGSGTDVFSKDIVKSISESDGFAMVGNKKVPIRVYTGAEGKQTVILPETMQEGLRVTGGKIKIEIPGSKITPKKEINLETDIDFIPLSSGNVKSTAVVRDVKGDETIISRITRQTTGLKGSSLDETISFSKPRESVDITDMYKTTAFRQPVGTVETPKGTVNIMQSEFVSAGAVSKPGSSIQQSVDEMLGIKTTEGLPTINIMTPKRPATVPKISQTEGIKSPMTQFDDILKTPVEIKTPIGSKTPKVESGSMFQTQKPVSKYQQQISQTQFNIAAQRVKSFVGEMEATNILDDISRIKSAPIKYGIRTPITSLDQLSEFRMKGMEQNRQTQMFKNMDLSSKKQETSFLKSFSTSTDVLKDQDVYKSFKTDISTKSTSTSSLTPISQQTQITSIINAPPSTQKIDRPGIPLIPPFPGLGLGSGSSMFGKRGKMGTKTNPLGKISDTMGRMFKK